MMQSWKCSKLSRNGNVTDPDNPETGLMGLKIEICSSIQLNDVDSYYGRKQVITIPPSCHTVYQVKQHVKSVIQLPANIHFTFGEFCLRDDQDIGIFSCFKEPVKVVAAQQEQKAITSAVSQTTTGFNNLSLTPKHLPQQASNPQCTSSAVVLDSHIVAGAAPKSGNKRAAHFDVEEPSNSAIVKRVSFQIVQNADTTDSSSELQLLTPKILPTPPEDADVSDSQEERLTKSAKRRLRKLRIQNMKSLDIDLSSTSTPTLPEEKKARKRQRKDGDYKSNIDEEASNFDQEVSENLKKAKDIAKMNASIPFTPSPLPLSNMSTLSINSDEFVKPRPRKKKLATTPLENGTSDIKSTSSGKKRPDTPYLVKVVKNPMVFEFPEFVGNSSIEELGSSSKIRKPDTPNLPMVSKSPHYNYVNRNTFSRLSREYEMNMALVGGDESKVKSELTSTKNGIVAESKAIVTSTIEKANEAVGIAKREEMVERMKKSLRSNIKQNNVDVDVETEEIPTEQKGANGLENREAYYDNLEDINSIHEVQEGNVIAFKATEINDESCPVVSAYKEALVKLKQGSLLYLEYLNADTTKPVLFEVEGYTTSSPNNPDCLDFQWMMSPKNVPRSPE